MSDCIIEALSLYGLKNVKTTLSLYQDKSTCNNILGEGMKSHYNNAEYEIRNEATIN